MQIPPPYKRGSGPTDARGWEFDGYQWLPPEPVPMSIYDILRKLIAGDPWGEEERREAEELITTLEASASLGTISSSERTRKREENVA